MKKIHLTTIAILGIVVLSNAQTQVGNFSPKNIVGGIGQILTISGNGFGNQQGTNFISFIQESATYMDASQGRALKYISWIDAKIEVEMPCAFSGKIHVNIGGIDYISNDTLQVKANLQNRTVNPLDYTYLTDQNKKGGYTWYIHRQFWEIPAAKDAIEAVFKEFRCKTGVNYILANEPSDAALTLSDNINLIAPDATLSSVGYCYSLWNNCIVGSIKFYQTKSMDVGMSTKEDWYFGNGKVPNGKAKFRYVLMHELGHSLGLGHVNEIGQTMYPSVTNLPSNNWSERDSITTEEKLAISHFVKLSQDFTFRGCGISPLSKISNCEYVYGLGSGTENVYKIRQFNIFPNPCNGNFKIEMDNSITNLVNIEIYSLVGRKILTIPNIKQQNPIEINLAELPKGTYLAKINTRETVYTERIIIQ
ncbi:MAG: T9SS type A sorting domain-containing protein [Flavobacteriaceae bacterium]|nr:T9SS type A sorting domain-containing protein [Flavobacteriaceae bacterium]